VWRLCHALVVRVKTFCEKAGSGEINLPAKSAGKSVRHIIRLILPFTLILAAHAATIVVPGSSDGAEGDINQGFPFNISFFSRDSQRYQQLYQAGEFPGPMLITGMDFRLDSQDDPFSSTLPSIQIDLATAVGASLNTTFANNVGPDDTTVFAKGLLALSSAGTGPADGPKDFDIHIQFTTPFFYDPSKGSLLLDVRNFGGGSSAQFDAVSSSGDSVSRVASFDVDDPSGPADTIGLVTRFDFVAVPEPATGAIAGLAIAALFARRLVRR